MIKKSLVTADSLCRCLNKWASEKRNYFSTLAKILHSWRDNARKMRAAWQEQYGPLAAFTHAKPHVPRVLSGRWGYVEQGEKFLLDKPVPQLRTVAEAVLRPKCKNDAKANSSAASSSKALPDANADDALAIVEMAMDGCTELSLEASKSYTDKMGRWNRASLAAIHCPTFLELILAVCHRSRAPLTEYFCWLEKSVSERSIDGEQRMVGKVADLVWHKSAYFLEKFEGLTTGPPWTDLLSKTPDEDAKRILWQCIRRMTIQHHADFSRRVGEPMTRLQCT